MNKDEARIVILEDALEQSYHTIQFLHQCLMGQANYSYPYQTIERLEQIDLLIPIRKGCHHSVYNEGCEGCEERTDRNIRMLKARVILNADI